MPPAAPRPPTREQPATPARQGPPAPLHSPTGEFLTEQARAAGPPPQPGVVPARVFRPAASAPPNPPLPSLGVRIAPVIPPLAPVKEVMRRAQPAAPAPRVPHRPTRDPMSETSLGIPVMPPLPPVAAGPLPPLDLRIAPLVPSMAPVSPTAPPADPVALLAWKAERLDALDYFELLGVPTTASAAEVKRAFYRESRAYHPDRFFHLTDEAFKTRVHEVYKRVTEAYYVLRDDLRRHKYLADVTGPDRAHKLRFDELAEQETKAAVKQQAAEQIGLNPKARQLFQTAMTDLERGNLQAAERGLKMALTYERENALYKDKLAQVQGRLYEESRAKAFKIT
ncbi:MAG TPA: DnaJ domain-containing protein [Myxococcaceae bacterium]|nr:DnaJ domain-containing protein [Myxococcaceae bacterium]